MLNGQNNWGIWPWEFLFAIIVDNCILSLIEMRLWLQVVKLVVNKTKELWL